MGSPKARLEWHGETFAARLARVFGECCDPVLLVTGAIADLTAPPARVVHNPDWRLGQLTSLQAGLRQAGAAASFFIPVDCPLVRPETVRALREAWSAAPDAVFVIPRFGQRRGHPVLASPTAVRELLALPADGQAREVVHRYRGQTVYVDVEDAGILADVDTPADYEAIRQ